jgi:hypothetical protein
MNQTRRCEVFQELVPDLSESRLGEGELRNSIAWSMEQPGFGSDHRCKGDLVVACKYKTTSKGELDVTLEEHLLIPESDPPGDVEELVMAIQRTVPFEMFDPDAVLMQNTVSG